MLYLEIRDALEADDDDDQDVAISFDNLYQSKNILHTIKIWLLSYIPFRSNLFY